MNSFIIEQCPPLYIDRSLRRVPIRSVNEHDFYPPTRVDPKFRRCFQ